MAGSTSKVHIKVETTPILSITPMLAVPACVEVAKFPKLTMVVNALKNTARAVLVCSKLPCAGRAVLYRCRICSALSTPIPSNSGNAMILAKLKGNENTVDIAAVRSPAKISGASTIPVSFIERRIIHSKAVMTTKAYENA